MKNKYINRAHISEIKFREILKFFAADFTVSQIAKENPLLSGDIEADESYFGAKTVRALRGRGAKGKIKVFGLLKKTTKYIQK